MNKHRSINKSALIWSRRCEKASWMYMHKPEFRDSISDLRKALFLRGLRVGILARELFPNGIDVSSNVKPGSMEHIEATKLAMEGGSTVLYEAAFTSNDCISIADILVKSENAWDVYEVKSSVSINDNHHLDLSFQYLVMTDAGIKINDLYFIHVNEHYVKKEKLNLNNLFRKKIYTRQCKKSRSRIRKQAEELKLLLAQESEPQKEFGMYCLSPSPCDFYAHCWKHLPQPSVIDLSGVQMHKKVTWIQQGIHLTHDIPSDEITPSMEIPVSSLKDGAVVFDQHKLAAFLERLSYPIFFIDFETFQSPVPIFEGTKPNQFIPVQYSVHRVEKENAIPVHSDFLAQTHSDPVPEFINSLLDTLEKSGSILVYNQSFEASVMRKLKENSPENAGRIDAVIDRMVDLMIPFKDKILYHPDTMGSYSIKYILPAFVDHNGYKGLKVANGAMATMAYEEIHYEQDEHIINEIRNSLLEYCKMDTYAMILLLDVIKQYAKDRV